MRLQKGDVVKLKKGMRVYADILEKHVYPNKKVAHLLTRTEVEVGAIFTNRAFRSERVILLESEQFILLEEGEFLVIKTALDGCLVFCKALKNGKYDKHGIEVDFYQKDPSTRVSQNIKPIRKMEV